MLLKLEAILPLVTVQIDAKALVALISSLVTVQVKFVIVIDRFAIAVHGSLPIEILHAASSLPNLLPNSRLFTIATILPTTRLSRRRRRVRLVPGRSSLILSLVRPLVSTLIWSLLASLICSLIRSLM
jgi:hypothetical protein